MPAPDPHSAASSASPAPLRVGLVGFGFAGQTFHAPVISAVPGLVLAAVALGKPLDMGTSFDYFGTLANTESPQATPAQHANRELLRAAMEREGFRNYAMEWWHYTLTPEPTPDTIYDVPVQ